MGRPSVWKQLQRAFSGLFKTLHILFLEMTGFLFLVLGGIILFSAYRQIRSYLDLGEVSYYKLTSTVAFGGLMLGYGVHSFLKAKVINRRQARGQAGSSVANDRLDSRSGTR